MYKKKTRLKEIQFEQRALNGPDKKMKKIINISLNVQRGKNNYTYRTI